MKTILLYGFLGRQFGRVHRYDVQTPAEAVKAMMVTLKGFRQALVDGGAYRVLVGGRDPLTRERLMDPISSSETLRFVPVISGAGKGIGQFLLGAVLVVAGAFTGGWITYIGFSLMMGGASQMLFSQTKPESVERPENKASFGFNGAVNTATQGNPVPVLYGGPMIVGSQVISAGLSAEQI